MSHGSTSGWPDSCPAFWTTRQPIWCSLQRQRRRDLPEQAWSQRQSDRYRRYSWWRFPVVQYSWAPIRILVMRQTLWCARSLRKMILKCHHSLDIWDGQSVVWSRYLLSICLYSLSFNCRVFEQKRPAHYFFSVPASLLRYWFGVHPYFLRKLFEK